MKKRPTALEQKVLHRLWDLGDTATVSEVIDGWRDGESPGYTTVLKVLQNMEEKGLVSHQRSGRAYRYTAQLGRDELSRSRIQELLHGFFKGDSMKLVNALVDEVDLSREEIKELRRLLADKAKEAEK
jgi:BlaI family transcriptional regulator, penicillinase repressor